MAWQILTAHPSPIQRRVTIVNDDPAATPTTDYHAADALARKELGAASLTGRGQSLTGRAVTFAYDVVTDTSLDRDDDGNTIDEDGELTDDLAGWVLLAFKVSA